MSIESAKRGIIPACAGNTSPLVCGTPAPWDHPRVCGEHLDGSDPARNVLGSSPRVRGTRRFLGQGGSVEGIIPACAGNTMMHVKFQDGTRDHPRVCGEHFEDQNASAANEGSSPRVRGTLMKRERHLANLGIIPACAGNTAMRPPRQRRRRDHPRVCGEHSWGRRL